MACSKKKLHTVGAVLVPPPRVQLQSNQCSVSASIMSLTEDFSADSNSSDSDYDTLDVQPLNRGDMMRLTRLIFEGLEVALHLGNTFLSSFGPARLIDILEQILPTAYIVNTSYWPFYRTEDGFSPCICDNFGINCPHTRNLSWINLDRELNEVVLFKDGAGIITLTDIELDISRDIIKRLYLDSSGCPCYKYLQMYELQLQFKAKNCSLEIPDEYDGTIRSNIRFQFMKPKEELNKFCLWFSPHPLDSSLYGAHFSFLLGDMRPLVYPNSLVVSWDKSPNYTIQILEKCIVKNCDVFTPQDVGLDENRKRA